MASRFQTDKLGYKAILDHIQAAIPEHMFQLNTTVLNINYSDIGVTLKTSRDHKHKRYDYVIVTSSLGHLKKYHQKLFTPPLPRKKIEAIEKIGFGGASKIFFRWKQPWWSNKTYSIMPLPVKGMARNTIDKFDRALNTLQILDWEPNTTIAWIGGESNKSIEPPVEIIRSRLTKDDLLLGSYSYLSVAQAKAQIPHSRLAIPVKQNKRLKVLFAGEATHHRLFQTAIGSYLSGRREADRLNLDWESRNPVRMAARFAKSMRNHSKPACKNSRLPVDILPTYEVVKCYP
ncbi:hypothetical protein KIN20_008813 [Parelaphostrongylus tenuis]|uniref:Amine oxidase domain-containing protein n=1 Tax=Parelaphostrongylus tenuis TaxID=148309 RepID=A0AAD5MA94_PARTN|nr:hypothetical protein KIN20_008813 [Parelaphostrongylus tenuis]